MKISCGILLFNKKENEVKVFLIHPGGPYFKNKDDGYWGIPKGIAEEGEDLISAAKREFMEETGIQVTEELFYLGEVEQKGGKIVHCWGAEYKGIEDIQIECNTFDLEWPPKSGRTIKCPEVDQGKFYTIETAKKKINEAQIPFIERLLKHLKDEK
jgi:predicted NUDIX family NTP pyrophosphohydrolase